MLSCAKSVGHPVPFYLCPSPPPRQPPLDCLAVLHGNWQCLQWRAGRPLVLSLCFITLESFSRVNLAAPLLPPLTYTAERGWKNNFENLFSLILIRCKSFAFPLCAICVSDMDIAQQGRRRREWEGIWGTGGVANNYFFRFGQLVPF